MFWVKQGTGGVGRGGNTADVDGDKDVDGGAIVTAGGLLVVVTVATEGKAAGGGGSLDKLRTAEEQEHKRAAMC